MLFFFGHWVLASESWLCEPQFEPFRCARFDFVFALIFGFAGLGYVLTSQATSFTETMIAMAVGGLSVGAFLPNTNMAIISRASMQVRGRALGALTTLFFLGQFASPFYSVPLATRFSVGHAFEFSGYALFALGGGFAVFTLVRRLRARSG